MSENKANSSWLDTKLKDTKFNEVSSEISDLTGKTLENFHVDRKMDIPSGEADIYLCSGIGERAGKSYVLKYYRRENAVKPDVVRKLMEIKSPCVAPVESFGIYENRQYTVLPYYKRPALSVFLERGVRFSEVELRIGIIPSVIEGLRVLHEAGVLHKDLKPANLIPDDTGEHVVLIDFDISSEAGGNTFATSCYAAPEAMQGDFYRETDYYALGITIYELFTGDAPSQNSGMSGEESERLSAVSKIEFPKDFPDKLKELVLGLTYKDISHRNEKDNPNRRWGYDEVERWLNGEDVPVPGKVEDKKFIPYDFGGVRHSNVRKLAAAMLKNPDEGITELRRGILTHHFGLFDSDAERLCGDAEEQLRKTDDIAESRGIFCRLMYALAPGLMRLYCDGREMQNLTDLSDAALTAAASGDEGFCSDLGIMLKSFLEYYAAEVLKSDTATNIINNVNNLIAGHKYTDIQAAWVFGYAFSERRNLRIHDETFKNVSELRDHFKKLEAEKGFQFYFQYIEECRQELEFFVSCYPDNEGRLTLEEILDDLNRAIFGQGELQFRNAGEFDDYVAKLLKEKQPYRLWKLLNIYGFALKEVSETVWKSSSYDNLKQIVSEFVSFDEKLFVSVQDLKAWLEKILSKNSDIPEFLSEFVRFHDSALSELEKKPELSKVIGKLRSISGSVNYENHDSITIKGVSYPTVISVKKGDVLELGSYPQGDDRTESPIEWQVLEICDNKALLVSRYGLDCRPYHHEYVNMTWEECDLRDWLNNDFMKLAFSNEEIERIKVLELENERNRKFGTSGGRNTEDSVFCFSLAEAEQYFGNDRERQCQPTPYACKHGASVDDTNCCCWWLRSPGMEQNNAAAVGETGNLLMGGFNVFRDNVTVRPALWIDLHSVLI